MDAHAGAADNGRSYCGAKRRQGGEPCHKPAGWGVPGVSTGRCRLHGGATGTHKVTAERAALAARVDEARRACSLLGLDVAVESDPGAALLDEMQRAERAVHHWGGQVAVRVAEGEQVDRDSTELVLWMLERKTLADVSAKAQHLGIAQRRVELDEDMARLIMSGFAHFARLAGLDPEAPAVRRAGREALQLVAGGSV